VALEKDPNLPYAHYMAALVKFWEKDPAGHREEVEKAGERRAKTDKPELSLFRARGAAALQQSGRRRTHPAGLRQTGATRIGGRKPCACRIRGFEGR
jgi:hypothetical protein